jgi:hypothetical protein
VGPRGNGMFTVGSPEAATEQRLLDTSLGKLECVSNSEM